MIRAFLVAVAVAAAALTLATPVAAEPAPVPCGSDMCATYHQLDGEDDSGAAPTLENPLANLPFGISNLSVCGDIDTGIPFVGVISTCMPLQGG
jgi:hypothetical protein